MCEHCTRREFLGTGVASGLMLAGATWSHAWASQSPPPQSRGKSRICVVFTGTPVPEDRNWGADARQIEAMKTHLAKVEKELGNVELITGQSSNAQQTAALLKKAGHAAPVLVINVQNFALTRVVKPILDGSHPMVVFSLPASGHDWMYAPRWHRRGHRVTLLASSDYDELERALRLLRVIPMMKQTRILLFPPARGTTPARSPDQVKKRLGADVVAIEEKTFNEMISAAEEGAVRAEINRWTKNAKEIIEPDKEDIRKAARISVALQRLMEQERAQGLAVGTCMGWLSKGFPCLGFARLRDKGIPAACEGDMDSLLTMLLFQYMIDRPQAESAAWECRPKATKRPKKQKLQNKPLLAPGTVGGCHSRTGTESNFDFYILIFDFSFQPLAPNPCKSSNVVIGDPVIYVSIRNRGNLIDNLKYEIISSRFTVS